MIGGIAPGKSVEVTVWRDGKSKTSTSSSANCRTTSKQASATPGRDSDADQSDSETLADLGLTVTPADDGKGLVVTDVDPDSDAAERGMQAGDVITAVNTNEVSRRRRRGQGDRRGCQGRPQGRAVQVTRDDGKPLRGAARRQGLIARRVPGAVWLSRLAGARDDPQRLRVVSHPWAGPAAAGSHRLLPPTCVSGPAHAIPRSGRF